MRATWVAAGAALAAVACGPEEWSFDSVDAGAGDASLVGANSGAPEGGMGGRNRDAGFMFDSGYAFDGGASPCLGLPNCVPCVDDESCSGLAEDPFCGIEQRCVECTMSAQCGPRHECVDEHCVLTCTFDSDCDKNMCGPEGTCLDCKDTVACDGFQQCSPEGLCVDCTSTKVEFCGGGSCSPNGYCVGPNAHDF